MKEPFILFQINGATYAVPAAQVEQVEMIDKVTRVPNAPFFVDGIVYVRGRVIPVINMHERFGFPSKPYDLHSRIIVVRLGDRIVGLAVDSAREFVQLDREQMTPPPEIVADVNGEYLQGVISEDERLILILDIQRVLTPDEQDMLGA
ncbi:MAG: chemotaxis protein CheW [Chloroflexi bacterium]|nr:chemotaxis protein CheW [Chloroflexota bacterium]